MKIFEINEEGYPHKILVQSFEDYQKLGGTRDQLDAYAFIKERAKRLEGEYIQMMDMSLSGIPVPEEHIAKKRAFAQVNYDILHLWFNRPLRVVNYSTFDLSEFNRM